MMILLCFFGGFAIAILGLLVAGAMSSERNQVELSRSFSISSAQLWHFIRNVDLMASRRSGIRSIEVLREQHGKIIEWMVHTTRGGFRVYRMEERPTGVLTKILVSSTFNVTGRWDYHVVAKNEGVQLSIEETSTIPSFFYRAYLLLRGRDLHLQREMKRIDEYITTLAKK